MILFLIKAVAGLTFLVIALAILAIMFLALVMSYWQAFVAFLCFVTYLRWSHQRPATQQLGHSR